jgi:hypothetical protein
MSDEQSTQPTDAPANPFDAIGTTTADLSLDDKFVGILQNPFHPQHKTALDAWDKANMRAEETSKQNDEQRDLGGLIDSSFADVPAEPDGYQVNPHLPPGIAADPEMVDFGRDIAHSLGMSQSEFASIEVAWNSAAATFNKAGDATSALQSMPSFDGSMAALNNRYGADGAKTVVADAQAFLARLPPAKHERVVELLEVTGLGNSPALIESLAQMQQRRQRRAK